MDNNKTRCGVLQGQEYSPSLTVSGRPSGRRACTRCRKKKTRCDTKYPNCSLCSRTGGICVYRTRHGTGSDPNPSPNEGPSTVEALSSPTLQVSSLDGTYGTSHGPHTSLYSPDSFLSIESGSMVEGMAPCVDLRFTQNIFTIPSPRDTMLMTSLPEEVSELGISDLLANELVELFFDNVHNSCPIFRRSTFRQTVLHQADVVPPPFHGLSATSRLILNSMFALSARFSDAVALAHIEPASRGDVFMARAIGIWESISRTSREELSTIQCLQGLILLSFNMLQHDASVQPWLMVGSCTRLAYELDLHNTDADLAVLGTESIVLDIDENMKREEKRRTWWTIWEMDTFSSTTSLRPYAINDRQFWVLLPLSDQCWEGATPLISSAFLGPCFDAPWQALSYSENQNERAWFLICLAVLRMACETALSPMASLKDINHMEGVIGSLSLSLPSTFHILPKNSEIDKSKWHEYSWIICSSIVLEWYVPYTRWTLKIPISSRMITLSSARTIVFNKGYITDRSACSIIGIYRAANLIPLQFIPNCSPFIFCALVGPGTTHVPVHRIPLRNDTASICAETIQSVLRSVARHWKIGKLLLGISSLDFANLNKSFSANDFGSGFRYPQVSWEARLQRSK